MPIFQANPDARFYGHVVGVICLDCVQPNIPGDVANASSYDYPVLFNAVEGLSTQAAKSGDPAVRDSVVAAAIELEKAGVKAISSNCGFLQYFQEDVAEAVSVPVIMSSLAQAPLILTGLSRTKKIGILTADHEKLTADVLEMAGLTEPGRYSVAGMQDSPEFRRAMRNQSGSLDSDALEAELAEAAQTLTQQHPTIGAILLECAVFTPYRAAVHQATGLPCFDFLTAIDWLAASTTPRRFTGHY